MSANPSLKKIPIEQVRLGMHLHAVEASWLDNPFWRSRFLLKREADLDKLRRSGARACWIDISAGLDVEDGKPAAGVAEPKADASPTASPVPAEPARSADTAPPPVPSPPREAPARHSLADELQRAAGVVRDGRAMVGDMFEAARMGRALDAERCLPVVEAVTESVDRNPHALLSLTRLRKRHEYTYTHSVSVCALMVALGRQIGLDEASVREAGLAGLLHDIGKAVMPESLLDKPSQLTNEEFSVIRTHPVRGWEILQDGRMASEAAMDVSLHHHERVDGTGYPHNLQRDKISLYSRMGAICDVYDAITSHRAYKARWDPAESLARMQKWTGHFDEELFNHFVGALGIYPIGAIVLLQSQRVAVVYEQNANALEQPVVQVFYSNKSRMPVPLQRVDLAAPGCHDRIVGREPMEAWASVNLDSLWTKAPG
ncbi:MAG: hypothetical protein RI988_2267 [Pseudomonadota bacterium]